VQVGDAATLITAITGLVTAATGLVGAVVVLVKVSRRERPRAARNLAAELAKAAEDGQITPDELRQIAEGDGTDPGKDKA
jgi:hypothetical protein